MFEVIKTTDEYDSVYVKLVSKMPYFEYEFPYALNDEMKAMTDKDLIAAIKPYFIDHKEGSTQNILIDLCIRNPFIYDVQFEKIVADMRPARPGDTYYPGAIFSVEIPNYEPKGYEGNRAMVTVNRALTIKSDETDIYKVLDNYHQNGIVEIFKWTDIVHLNPNDFKKKADE